MPNSLAIITGASSNHFACLLNLLHSIDMHEPNAAVIVWDLGLAEDELRVLSMVAKDVRHFDFTAFPPHVGQFATPMLPYAWKPIIISDMLERAGNAPLLWLDAGNLVHRPLHEIREVLLRYGFYSPRSPGSVGQWTHPETLRLLGAADEILAKRNRNGAIVGVQAINDGIAAFIRRWKECALDPRVMYPAGWSRDAHRSDQAILSVLVHQYQARCGYVLADDFNQFGISIHNDRMGMEAVQRWLQKNGVPI